MKKLTYEGRFPFSERTLSDRERLRRALIKCKKAAKEKVN